MCVHNTEESLAGKRRGILGFYTLGVNEAGEPDIFVASLEEMPLEVFEGLYLAEDLAEDEGLSAEQGSLELEVCGEDGGLLLYTEGAVRRWADLVFEHWEVMEL